MYYISVMKKILKELQRVHHIKGDSTLSIEKDGSGQFVTWDYEGGLDYQNIIFTFSSIKGLKKKLKKIK